MFTELQGFFGSNNKTLIRLFRPDLLDDINRQYWISEYLPGYRLIGSDTALEGIFISPRGEVVRIPFIPLSAKYEETLFGSLQQFKAELDRSFTSDTTYPCALTRMAVLPIAFGGSPTDPANFKDAAEEIHVKATAFWNKVYADRLRKSKEG